MAQLVVAAAGAAIGGATLGTGVVALGMTGTAIGWMAGSLIGSMFAKGPDGPKIEDGKFSSSIYGQPIPLNYGTMRHATQIAWWSGLIVRTEEVGGKGGGGADIERARMNLLLAVCEGPQAGVLRIWANGRLIATWNGLAYELDKDVLPAGDVRVYLGTEDQMPDPTYEEVVGTENAVPYRGMVMLAIDGLEGEQFGNRPPNIECEVATALSAVACPLDPVQATEVQQASMFEGLRDSFSSALMLDADQMRAYIVTRGADGLNNQIEEYSVGGPRPSFMASYALAKWNKSALDVEGMGWDPENRLLRIAAGGQLNDGITPIEYILKDGFLFESAAKFTYAIPRWGDFPDAGQRGGNGAYYGVVYSIYPDLPTSGSALIGEAGWWMWDTAIIQYRLAHLMNGNQGGADAYAWHHGNSDGRSNYTSDVVYVPKGAGAHDGGGFNIAWRWDEWRGYYDKDASAVSFGNADGTDKTIRRVTLVYAPNRERVYVVTQSGSIASVDVSVGGDPTMVDAPLTAFPDEISAHFSAVGFAVWNEKANGLIIGQSGSSGLAMALIDPDALTLLAGPCIYSSETMVVTGAKDLGDGRFVAKYGDQRVAIIEGPGGEVSGRPVTLQFIVEDLCRRTGLPAENLDATAGTDLVAGFKVARQMSAKAVIDSLRPVYFFDMPEVGEQLVLTKRGAAPVVALTAGELGASLFQATRDEPVPPYEIEHVEAQEIPRRLELSYVDFTADYDPGVQAAERQVGESRSPLQVEAPVVLSAEEAARVAWANLLLAHSSNGNVRLALSHAHDALSPSDAIEIPHASGDTIRVRIEQITRARPLVEIEGVIEDASVYEQFMGGVMRYQGPQNGAVGEVGDTILVLLDIPPLRDQDDALLVYAAMARADFDAYWPGGTLYKSSDGGSSYQAQFSTGTGATIGRTTSPLADFTAGNVWDDVSQLDVVVTSGSFASASDAAVLNGANAVAVQAGTDWEIVQFANAELIGTNAWRLTRLLRGRIGTERCIDGHANSDRVVALTSAIRIVDQQFSERGTTRQYKGVTSNQPVADANAQPLTLMGRSLMPLSPVHITAGRAANNDVVIDWTRRARINAGWPWNGSDIPLDEPTEQYEVEIFDGASVVRVLTANTSQVTYTASQQSADFGGSMPTDFIVAVYQMSSRVGRGWPGLGQFGLPGYSYEPDVTPVPVPTPGGGSGTTTPPATSNDARRFGWPMWFDGKWWSAPENETVAVDLGANADQFVRSSAAKWAKDRYRTRVNYDASGPGDGVPGVWGESWNIGKGNTWLATDGTVIVGTFADDPEFVSIYNDGLPNGNIQAWAPEWTGPKIARRRNPGPGESVWYVQEIIDEWGAPSDTNSSGAIYSAATDGTTWAFAVRQNDNASSPFLVTTTDFVSWTAINLDLLPSLPFPLNQLHIMHNGTKWVMFVMAVSLQTEIYTSTDLSTWTKEADPPWVGPFASSAEANQAYVNRVVVAWGGDWYYLHREYDPNDVDVYKSSDLISWSSVYSPSVLPNSLVRLLVTSGKFGWWDGDKTFIGTTDGTTWTETTVGVSPFKLMDLSRGVAVPSAPQSLPSNLVFATQIDAGQGGALFKLDDFADVTPTFSLQPVTTYGARVRTVGQRLGGEFREGGKVMDGVSQAQLFKVHTTGKRYFEARWDALSGVSMHYEAEVGAGDICYSWYGGVYSYEVGFGYARYVDLLSGPRLTAGDVVGVGVDADTRTATFWVNGALIGSVPIGSTQFGYTEDALAAVVRPWLQTVKATVLTYSDELIYPLPAGYTAWND